MRECSTAWRLSLARTPFVSPEFKIIGGPVSSNSIYATTPALMQKGDRSILLSLMQITPGESPHLEPTISSISHIHRGSRGSVIHLLYQGQQVSLQNI